MSSRALAETRADSAARTSSGRPAASWASRLRAASSATGRRGRLPGAPALGQLEAGAGGGDRRLGGADVLRAPGGLHLGQAHPRRPMASATEILGLAPARTVARRDWAAETLAWALATLALAWATWASLVVWSSSASRSPAWMEAPTSKGW